MIHVLIVDDLNIVRQGIKTFLADKTDIKVIGSVKNGLEAVEFFQKAKTKPDIALIDLLMPVMGGIKATEIISQQFPEAKIIIVSDLKDVNVASCAVKMGAKGYLLKGKLNANNLINAVYSVYNGYIQLDAEIVNSPIKDMANHSAENKNNTSNNDLEYNAFSENGNSHVVEDVWL